MPNELTLTLRPGGVLLPEWAETKERLAKSTELFQRDFLPRLESNQADALLFLGFSDNSIPLSPSLSFWRTFASNFAERLRLTPDIETLRGSVDVPADEVLLESLVAQAPMMAGAEHLTADVLAQVWISLLEAFRVRIRKHRGTVESLLQSLCPNIHLVGRVFFHLVENKQGKAPFAFLATYSTCLNEQGQSRHLPLRNALEEFGKDTSRLLDLLSTVRRAAKESVFLSNLTESGQLFQPLAWTPREAHTFLREVPLYEKEGILCRIPDWWKKAASRTGLKISIGDDKPSRLGMSALIDFKPQLMLGDAPVSRQELEKLMKNAEGLVLIKNRWVAVDPDKLQQALAAYDKACKMIEAGDFSFRDALHFELHGGDRLRGADQNIPVEISHGDWLKGVLQKLKSPELIEDSVPGKGFHATLRSYQQRGVNWLGFLHSLGFGMCIADDMGLGKTVQVLAMLHILKRNKVRGPHLLVVPASVLPNWQKEIERFCPSLRCWFAHTAMQDKTSTEPDDPANHDLVLTTYTLAQKYDWIARQSWNYVILDEAQAIRNPSAKQTQAIKRLSAKNRIAMTGTPVENCLSDLWSLFDFLNPGMLGSANEFASFAKRLSREADGYARLRQVVSPFILRRMKTDKSIINDLPGKVEMKVWTPLSRKQETLYDTLLKQLKASIEAAEGIQRRGIILSFLMKSKQICNHPDQYIGSGDFHEADSGKLTRLREICETIREKREQMLIFTQFREMTSPLQSCLADIFGASGPVLHGGTSLAERKRMVDDFQNPHSYVPFMVLSLKAGGVGLNLTAANHVVHFDRWWNPAVENQATDRAFRIGQRKDVLVHKFITKGTVEEKIDAMIEDKKKLAAELVDAGPEAWITEMSTGEIMQLFARPLA